MACGQALKSWGREPAEGAVAFPTRFAARAKRCPFGRILKERGGVTVGELKTILGMPRVP